jgi:hypothetical protein
VVELRVELGHCSSLVGSSQVRARSSRLRRRR